MAGLLSRLWWKVSFLGLTEACPILALSWDVTYSHWYYTGTLEGHRRNAGGKILAYSAPINQSEGGGYNNEAPSRADSHGRNDGWSEHEVEKKLIWSSIGI